MPPASPRQTHHLLPAFIALSLALLLVGGSLLYARAVIYVAPLELAAEAGDAKLQGIALQREAFSRADILVLYGSSELVKPMENMPTEYYANKRSGFGVFAVGKPGAASLNVLQRIGSVGARVDGRKLAFYISPGWFFTEIFDPKYYEGNFSEMQAMEVLFSSELSYDLRRDIASRMRDFPATLEGRDLLSFAADRLAGPSFWDRVQYALVWPLGKTATAIAGAQDDVEVALQILDQREKWATQPGTRPPSTRSRMLRAAASRLTEIAAGRRKQAEAEKRRRLRGSVRPTYARSTDLIQKIQKAREWLDFELLLRTLKELNAHPQLLAMPVENVRLEAYEASPEARTVYAQRLHELANKYGFPLRDFPEHQGDPSFTVDFQDHPSPKGWHYLNEALDDFYHGRPARTARAAETTEPAD